MKAAEKLLGLAYPACCMMCGQILPYGKHKTMDWVCAECGKQLPGLALEYMEHVPGFSCYIYRVFSVFRYDAGIREAIGRFKYSCIKDYANGMAGLVRRFMDSEILDGIIKRGCIFVPVPLHKSRLAERGFNQSELLADRLADFFEAPSENALARTKKTAVMFNLDSEQRRNNVKNAFSVSSEGFSRKTIILIDDLYTTGATVNECASVLKKAGAESIYALTFARTEY